MSESLKRLVLHDKHVAAGGRLAPFAGYEMAIRYGSMIEEHQAVRTKVGVFDVSHMGEVFFRGPDALKAVDALISNDTSKLYDGRALYTVMCAPDGGIVDDLIVYRLGPEEVLICVNAANRFKDVAWFQEHARGNVTVTDESDAYVQLAIQGPLALASVQPICDCDLNEIRYYHAAWGKVAGKRCLISRTGYTGEDGVELYIPAEDGVAVFDAVMAAGEPHGIRLIGLAARDTLRLEAKLPLYGNDLDATTNPLEAGLGWVVKTEGREFIGKSAIEAMRASGIPRKLRCLTLLERGVMRSHYDVFAGDRKIGQTTSGGVAPSLGEVSIALAYLDSEFADLPEVSVEIRGKKVPATVTLKPFYKRP